MKKQLKSFAPRVLLFVFIALVLGVSLYNLNAKMLLGEELPMPLGFGAAVVLSGSMEPELSENDLVIVKKTDEIYERQVVVFQDGASLVVHRIIELDGDTVVTQGDANNTKDDPISKKDIKGEVVFAIPFVGLLVKLLKTPLAVVLLLAAAVFLLNRSYRKEKDTKNDELREIADEIRALTAELKKKP